MDKAERQAALERIAKEQAERRRLLEIKRQKEIQRRLEAAKAAEKAARDALRRG